MKIDTTENKILNKFTLRHVYNYILRYLRARGRSFQTTVKKDILDIVM